MQDSYRVATMLPPPMEPVQKKVKTMKYNAEDNYDAQHAVEGSIAGMILFFICFTCAAAAWAGTHESFCAVFTVCFTVPLMFCCYKYYDCKRIIRAYRSQ